MAITNINEYHLANILNKGMLEGVRKNLKQQLMNTLEKEVDVAIDNTLSQFKGYVEANYDHMNGSPVFNIVINGVKK